MSENISELIKSSAGSLGFDACGIALCDEVSDAALLKDWLDCGFAASMQYMHNNLDKRLDPRLLVEGSRSIVVVAMNYYPAQLRDESLPYFSYYAYGKDYHDVIKSRLFALLEKISQIAGRQVLGRAFVDSAPVLERYWAVRAGIGFRGKNTQLIIPGRGSYFFLGELIIDLELEPDKPVDNSCGSCTRCLDACPAGALVAPYRLNACRCISYQTIENRDSIPPSTRQVMGNKVYGCDDCQRCCPWNINAQGNSIAEFQPSPEFLSLDLPALHDLTQEQFSRIFKGSAVKRAGYKGIKRNIGE